MMIKHNLAQYFDKPHFTDMSFKNY